ncbi:MAG: hypothetical protein KJ941_04970 [Bacteroidetes bacterium]|nr:hypothetical protein [Bacteroidota bacterium]
MEFIKMKLSNLFIGLSLCSAFSLRAQNMLPQDMDTNQFCYSVSVSGLFDFSSTSVERQMTQLYFLGGELTDKIKARSFNKHKGINNIGFELGGVVDYHNYVSNVFKNPKIGYVVRAGSYSYLSSNYSKDAFGLLFYGNSMYKGDTASFSGMDAKGIGIEKFGIGLIDKKSKTSLVLNGYNVSSYQDLNIVKGNLISDTTNNSLQLEMIGNYRTAKSSNFSKGWGMGFDLDYRLPVSWFNGKSTYFQFSMQNIGVMVLNQVTNYSFDTDVEFGGFQFQDVFKSPSDSTNNDYQDSLGLKVTTSSAIRLLPGFIQVGKLIQENTDQKWQSYFGVRLYTTLTYNPLIFIGGQYQASKNIRFGFQGSYGGFSTFRAGLYSQLKFKRTYVGLGTEDFYGMISKKARGQSVYLRISYRW